MCQDGTTYIFEVRIHVALPIGRSDQGLQLVSRGTDVSSLPKEDSESQDHQQSTSETYT
jgi:hypothetical protein